MSTTALLTADEAALLAQARDLLFSLNDRAFDHRDDDSQFAMGRVAEACDMAKTAVSNALITLKVYGGSEEAAEVL